MRLEFLWNYLFLQHFNILGFLWHEPEFIPSHIFHLKVLGSSGNSKIEMYSDLCDVGFISG